MAERIERYLRTELERRNVPFEIEHGGKHPRLVVMVSGQRRSLVFSTTARGRRSVQNALADLRRILR